MKRLFRIIGKIILFFFISSILAVVVTKWVPVYYTPLMALRSIQNWKIDSPVEIKHEWVSLDEINPSLPLAVCASEDNLFLTHSGFDLDQIEKAREEAERGRRVRGASTISQQTAKNVFLLPAKSYIRKGLEAYFTVLIELIWGKERIMEVYLNSIEMGKGIFGAQAVAEAHFHKSAKNLTRAESALIAASLPNPIKYNSQYPSRYMYKRQGQILSLMRKIPPVNFDK